LRDTSITKTIAAVLPKAAERQLRLRQRQKLIEACITAIHQHGPSRTTIDKVVTIADMSPGIVNFYFETKAALLVAALDFLATEFDERVLTPLAAFHDRPVLGLRRLIELYLDPDIASPRKVSVWYAFWGEATSRQEYLDICGKRDQAFADLVRDLMARLIVQAGATHLDADAVALGLIGALEMMWQEIAFQDEAKIDLASAARRCMAYLRSLFPAEFAENPRAPKSVRTRPASPPIALPVDGSGFHQEAAKMLLAAEMGLAGVPTLCVPASWPGYDVIAHPAGRPVAMIRLAVVESDRISIPAADTPDFDFLAILLQPDERARRLFIIPRAALPAEACEMTQDLINRSFTMYEGNTRLDHGAA
jgi:TetR/AcrR family transcriptional repressor of bet genes